MKKEIELNKRKIEYTLKVSKRSKKLRLAVYLDGNFVVTIPKNIPIYTAEQFILRKSNWVLEKLALSDLTKPNVVEYTHADYLRYKEQAMTLVKEKLSEFNKVYGFKFNKVTIKNQKTCWGSCSKKGNLNFNYKIALLPEKMADYIIVHELCHLSQLNHSYEFWNLVAKTIPDYQHIRKELKRHNIPHIN